MSHPLPARPSLSLLKNQAKTLRKACSSNQPDARLRVQTYHPTYSKSVPADLSLRDAQLVVAREYGFESWSDLKRKVEIEAEKTDFQKHKAERIKKCTSSPDEIAQVVQDACGSSPKHTERITAGYSNEVHRVDTEDGQTVIYRASWYNQEHTPHFEDERWALEQCKKVGVPAPDLLYLNHDFEGHPKRSICVRSFVPGQMLHTLLGESAISEDDFHDALRQLGEWYGRLHTVSTEGFGPLDGVGRGKYADWRTAYLDGWDHERLMQAAKNAEIDFGLIEEALQLLESHAHLGDAVTPVLLHWNFNLQHLIMRQNKLIGLIDFEYCQGGDPAQEAGWYEPTLSGWLDGLNEHKRPTVPTAPLIEGYQRVQKVDDAFWVRAKWLNFSGRVNGLYHHGISDVNIAGRMPFLNWRFKQDLEQARKHFSK